MSRPTIWDHRHQTNLVRFVSSIRPDMIFGREKGRDPVISPRKASAAAAAGLFLTES